MNTEQQQYVAPPPPPPGYENPPPTKSISVSPNGISVDAGDDPFAFALEIVAVIAIVVVYFWAKNKWTK